MTINLENAIHDKLKCLPSEKQQRVLAIVEQMLQEEAARGRSVVRPLWQIAEEISSQVPLEEWEKLPVDGAEQHDHYLYGSPKTDIL